MQITSLLFLPDFPGWTAPLHFNPIRFEELAIFCITLCVCWVCACGVVGGYRTGATASERSPPDSECQPACMHTLHKQWAVGGEPQAPGFLRESCSRLCGKHMRCPGCASGVVPLHGAH